MRSGKTALAAVLTILAFFGWYAGRKGSEARSAGVFTELTPRQLRAAASGISPRVADIAPARPGRGKESGRMGRAEEQAREVPNNEPFRKQVAGIVPDSDAALSAFSGVPMPPPSVSFEGLSSNDNFAAYGFRIIPPDTIGDVGPDHYVQAVNALFRVFDKSGNPLTPPMKISSLFASLGTACSLRDDGDPIVLYDQLADRWFISQFCKKFPPFRQMIAISRTGDPTGEFYVYEFVMPNIKLNDYPKFGVWGNAYHMTSDEFFGGDYAGSGVFAFDREAMLTGQPDASYIYFDLASPSTLRIGGLLPADLDGLNAPQPGTPGIFVGYTANEYGEPADAVRVFELSADFTDPANSTFSERPESPLPVPALDPTSNDGRTDIPQPPPGEFLDAQSDRLMYRAAYRELPMGGSLVVNQTVRLFFNGTEYHGGVRLHELRRQNGAFSVRGSSTIAAPDASRFMAAAAQDASGNVAVAYSTSGREKPPSIFYTGRLASDPPTIFRSERQFVVGTGVQTAFGFRWGDYSGLSVDPADDCTFWLTNQYYSEQSQTESPFGWLTRIGSFRYPECAPAELSEISGRITSSGDGSRVEGAVVSVAGGYRRSSGPLGNYGPLSLPRGSYLVKVEAKGYRSAQVQIDASAGDVVSDFVLEPIPLIVDAGTLLTSESCSADGSPEPGESVTIELSLKNEGVRVASDLTVQLLESGTVRSPSPAVSYGSLPAGGGPSTGSFSFTMDGGLLCGEEVALLFQLSDGGEDLGTLSLALNAGRRRIAFSENFDGVSGPELPKGWTTAAQDGQEIWSVSSDRADSAPNAVFSPDPRLRGINELVTPSIEIHTSSAVLSFRNWYELETTFLRNRLYDGSVLEISIAGGDWQDIVAAGGEFVKGGYDLGVIDSCCSNPLEGRNAWSGRSGTGEESVYVDSIVRLPASAAGNPVRLRWRVGTDVGTFREGQYIDDIVVEDGFECDCAAAPSGAPFDFDGDGKTDLSLVQPNDSEELPDLFFRRSSDDSESGAFWGGADDLAVNSDYDGDGMADLAVFRPGSGVWFVLNSSDGLYRAVSFGATEDTPVPADFDGDGKADIAVYRPSEGNWYILRSSDSGIGGFPFGTAGDVPVPADYDGDGRADVAVFRPSDGVWYVSRSSDNGFTAVLFGVDEDIPVPGDFDGDGVADLSVFRPSKGTWYQQRSTEGFYGAVFGASGDRPLQADFDGDGKRDIAVFRPSTGGWYYLKSSDGEPVGTLYGRTGFGALPSVFLRTQGP